ncbi:hypothetical protein ACWCW7_10385 [Nocardia tengchongensis]
MRFTVPIIVLMMAAVLLTGCSFYAKGPDQAERDRWSGVIESAIEALPWVTDASHKFQYHRYGPNSYYVSLLDVQLEDGATPEEAASVVRTMGAQQLPPHYRDDSEVLQIKRMTDSYFGSWRNVDREANAASTWARLSAAKTGAEIHWSTGGAKVTGDADGMTESISVRAGSEKEPHRVTAAMRRIIQDFPELASNDWTVTPVYRDSSSAHPSRLGPSLTHTDRRPRFPCNSELELWEWLLTDQPTPAIVEVSAYDPPDAAGRTLGVTVFPSPGRKFSAEQATQLADRHLRHLAQPGAVIDYRIITRNGASIAVLAGGCPESGREVSPESEPFARQYERC